MPDDRKIFTVLERSLITRGLGTVRPKLVCSASSSYRCYPSRAYLAVGIPVTRVHVYNANRSLDTKRILSRSVVNDAEGTRRCVEYTRRKGWLVVRQSRSSVCSISRFDVRGCRRPRSQHPTTTSPLNYYGIRISRCFHLSFAPFLVFFDLFLIFTFLSLFQLCFHLGCHIYFQLSLLFTF